MQKSILITGCSSGIGYHAAHALHKRGWRVFATCRQESDCERLRYEGLESLQLDNADPASIVAALTEILTRTDGTLDAVYNNGAFGIPGLVEDLSRDALRAIFEANLFGYFDIINRLMPVFRKQGHGRVINCSSVLGLTALRFRGAYNATKFAMEGLTDTMRLENRHLPIHFILLEPGPITTMIRQKAQIQFERWIDWQNSANRDFYERKVMPRLYDSSGILDPFELPPSAVTKKLIHALESRRPKPRYYVTLPTYIMGFLRRILTTRMLDRLASRF